jgi:hypothetical protein
MANLNFSTDGIEPARGGGDYSPLPPGWYEVTITGADLQKRKQGDDQLLKLTLETTARHGAHAGRLAWAYLCIDHPSEQTRTIARQQLAAVARALGKSFVGDTDELVGATIEVKLDARPADASKGTKAGNDVRAYRAVERNAPATPAPAAPAPIAAPARKATPPWGR